MRFYISVSVYQFVLLFFFPNVKIINIYIYIYININILLKEHRSNFN